jgi:uncharacterized membrane-anchored protein
MSIGKRTTLIGFFCILAVAQVWVPLSMIARREATLRKGEAYKFRTRPVDPYDAFRGRYVALGFESNEGTATNAHEFSRGQKVFVNVSVGTNGYATLGNVSVERPREGDYLSTSVRYPNLKQGRIRVKLPFNRFYMNEKRAPDAERQYRRAGRDEKRNAYALVRIRSGMAVIEDLYVDDKPILEFLKQPHETKP